MDYLYQIHRHSEEGKDSNYWEISFFATRLYRLIPIDLNQETCSVPATRWRQYHRWSDKDWLFLSLRTRYQGQDEGLQLEDGPLLYSVLVGYCVTMDRNIIFNSWPHLPASDDDGEQQRLDPEWEIDLQSWLHVVMAGGTIQRGRRLGWAGWMDPE